MKKSRKARPEEILHQQCAEYLKIQYPDVYFTFDPSGEFVGSKNSKGWQRVKATKAKKSEHAHLDMIILEPNSNYKGALIELKAKSPFKKNGELLSNKSYEDQMLTMDIMRQKGFFCTFVWTLDQFYNIVNKYMQDR